jgi:hypothetical protein
LFDLNICMLDYNINSPEDWYRIQRTIIADWKRNHGMFVHDIVRLEKTVEHHISEAGKKLVMYRQTHSRSYLEAAQAEYGHATNAIKTFSKRELLATLSKT